MNGEPTIQEMLDDYNKRALALGLKPRKAFRTKAEAIAGLEKLDKESKPKAKSEGDAFTFRSGSVRDRVVQFLKQNLGKQVTASAIATGAGISQDKCLMIMRMLVNRANGKAKKTGLAVPYKINKTRVEKEICFELQSQ